MSDEEITLIGADPEVSILWMQVKSGKPQVKCIEGLLRPFEFPEKGVKVFIDPGAIMYLLGTEMDYKKEQFSSSFVFKNPNETERCGCGESFKV